MNIIQVTKKVGQQWNILLDAVVNILKYNKITIDHDIYIKAFSDGTVSCLKVSTEDILNTNNNGASFPELTIIFEKHLEMKFQELSVLKYLNFRICKSPLGFIVDQTDHVMVIVNEWSPNGKFRNLIKLLRQTLHMKSNYWLNFD